MERNLSDDFYQVRRDSLIVLMKRARKQNVKTF